MGDDVKDPAVQQNHQDQPSLSSLFQTVRPLIGYAFLVLGIVALLEAVVSFASIWPVLSVLLGHFF